MNPTFLNAHDKGAKFPPLILGSDGGPHTTENTTVLPPSSNPVFAPLQQQSVVSKETRGTGTFEEPTKEDASKLVAQGETQTPPLPENRGQKRHEPPQADPENQEQKRPRLDLNPYAFNSGHKLYSLIQYGAVPVGSTPGPSADGVPPSVASGIAMGPTPLPGGNGPTSSAMPMNPETPIFKGASDLGALSRELIQAASWPLFVKERTLTEVLKECANHPYGRLEDFATRTKFALSSISTWIRPIRAHTCSGQSRETAKMLLWCAISYPHDKGFLQAIYQLDGALRPCLYNIKARAAIVETLTNYRDSHRPEQKLDMCSLDAVMKDDVGRFQLAQCIPRHDPHRGAVFALIYAEEKQITSLDRANRQFDDFCKARETTGPQRTQ